MEAVSTQILLPPPQSIALAVAQGLGSFPKARARRKNSHEVSAVGGKKAKAPTQQTTCKR